MRSVLEKYIHEYNINSALAAEKYILSCPFELKNNPKYTQFIFNIRPTADFNRDKWLEYSNKCEAFEYCIRILADTLGIKIKKHSIETNFAFYTGPSEIHNLPVKYNEYSIIED